MTPTAKVSIVILNYNGKKYLERFLSTVIKNSDSLAEVVLADNGSSDDSVEYARMHFPGVRIVSLQENSGFAQGYNLALRQVDADYYVLLNSDVEVTPGWLNPVIELMEKDNRIAACQPKILSFDRRDHFEYAGASGGWIDSLGFPFMRGRIFDECETDDGQYDDAMPCFWASGACLFVRASAFREAGGFDPYFFAHQEEIDLCWRLQHSGWKIYVQPATVVFHVGGGTLPPGSRKVFLNYRNNLIMIYKNLPLHELIWKIPVRFIINGLASMRELGAGRVGCFWAIIKAHLHFIAWLLFRQSGSVFSSRFNHKGLTGVYKGSVAWDYFALKKRRFSEIIVKE